MFQAYSELIDVGGCQNYGPLLGTLFMRCRIIIGIQKGTIILTTTHVVADDLLGEDRSALTWLGPRSVEYVIVVPSGWKDILSVVSKESMVVKVVPVGPPHWGCKPVGPIAAVLLLLLLLLLP